MAAGNTPASSSPARAQRCNKPRLVLKLRFAFRPHAEGVGERRVVGGVGRGEELPAHLPRCGSPPPTRRGEGGGAGRGGGDGEMSAWSSACPGGGAAAAHTCHACFKSFDRVKALYGHMRSCRGAAAAEEPPALPRQEREKKARAEKKDLLAKGLARTWAVTGTRGREGGRSPGHGANESYQAKSPRVAAPERARVAEILREVTGLQIREEDLDRPWVSEMVRGAKDLMFLTAAGDAVSGPVAAVDGQSEKDVAAVDGHSEKDVATAVPIPLAKIPEVKTPEHSSTVCKNSPVVPEIEVIVIDDDDEEPNNVVAEIDNTSSVTAATDQAAATMVLALPTPEAAAAVAIAPAPAATAAAAAAAVTIAVAGPGSAYVNGNGNGVVAATGAGGAGAGQIKMFPCPRCHKVFDCFRALGGHMVSHKNSERRARELQDIRDVSAALAVTLSAAGAVRARANAWANGRGYHVCVKCRRMFPTGQSLGGHRRLHYAGPPLIGNAGSDPEPWPVPPHAGGFPLHGPAATAANTAAFVHGPAATGIGAYTYHAATTNLFPLAFAVPKQEEEGKPPGVMAMAPPGNGGRRRLRLFGVDIVEGPKQEPME